MRGFRALAPAVVVLALLGLALWSRAAIAPELRPVRPLEGKAWLGPVAPFWLQAEWFRLAEAADGGRELDAVRIATRIAQLDPENGRARIYLAEKLAYTFAERESDPTLRLQRILRALRILRAVAQRDQADGEALLSGGLILADWMRFQDPSLYRRYLASEGVSPFRRAIPWLEQLRRREPENPRGLAVLAEAQLLAGIEVLLAGETARALGDFARAEANAVAAQSAFQTQRVRTWGAVAIARQRAESVRESDAALAALGSALAGVGAWVARLEEEAPLRWPLERALAEALLRPALDRLERALDAETRSTDPEAALRLIQGAHSILALRTGRSEGEGTSSAVDESPKRLRRLARTIVLRAPSLKDELPADLR